MDATTLEVVYCDGRRETIGISRLSDDDKRAWIQSGCVAVFMVLHSIKRRGYFHNSRAAVTAKWFDSLTSESATAIVAAAIKANEIKR
jgi:hypothetical protein